MNKHDEAATILSNREAAPGFHRMRLACPGLARRIRPGQFFQLQARPFGEAPLLRRPFAPSEVENDRLAFVYAVVGEGTRLMTRLRRGEQVRLLGPLGNGYRLPRRGARALLAGGGCGTPSLRFLARILVSRGCEVYSAIGARSACTLLEHRALSRLSRMTALATDDGSRGIRGRAMEAARLLLAKMPPRSRPTVFACGPAPMLADIARLAAGRGLRCQVSLEERMACGFGACMGCVVPISRPGAAGGFVYRRVCHDGPVFDAREVLWR